MRPQRAGRVFEQLDVELLPAEPGAFVFANDLIEKCRRQVGAIFEARGPLRARSAPSSAALDDRANKILETRLAVRRVNRLLECGVEFSSLTDAVEDDGPTLVQVAQMSQPLLELT